jgi:transmembrane protein
MPLPIARILDNSYFAVLARIVLTFPFWGSGLSKLIDFSGGMAEMAEFNLRPTVLFNAVVVTTLLLGALSIIFNRWTWLGAGALAVFTLLTIPIAHDFWNHQGREALMDFFFAVEHIGLIGGLMLVAILSRRSIRPVA